MVEHEMREILFRGKRIGTDRWVFGSLLILTDVSDSPHSINGKLFEIISIYGNHFVIDHSTISQYVDMNDKNGNKIFEGDIVKVSQSGSSYYAKIEYDCGCFWVSNPDIQIPDTINNFKMEFIEVVGNVYDNKELLR